MPNLTIRNIPDAVLKGLRRLSKEERRSLNSEILVLLEESLKRCTLEEHDNKISMEAQTEIWGKLAGEWEDARSAEETIADVLSRRTPGRKVEF
jgi:hypothetical protein